MITIALYMQDLPTESLLNISLINQITRERDNGFQQDTLRQVNHNKEFWTDSGMY